MSGVQRAIVLAAGLGTRLKWLTRDRPKALMHVAGEPAIVHVIRRLASHGIRDVAVNLHHHADVLPRALGDGSRWGVRLYFSREESLLDSGGGVRTALQVLPGSGPVLVHNGDIISDIDLGRLSHILPVDGCALAMIQNPVEHSHGDFALQDGLVSSTGKPRHTFSGISLWQEEMLLPLAVGQAYSLVHPMRVLMRQRRCAGFLHCGHWFDIGRPRSLIQASHFCSSPGAWYG
ncbi:MAG TPA: sugar phosphate nucleotidyltransferase [Mariprofundaceae bacterium]|nr:sugar phosphate nucleotidyltransferase [Mariprofundaceae bacterium]